MTDEEELDAVVVEVAPPALLAFFSLVYTSQLTLSD